MKTLADPRVKQFCDLINRGIEAWIEAGQILVALVADNPNIYSEILADNPHLTRDVLESFERIGRKEIYPYLVVDGSPGARRLAGLPYASQVRLYKSRVPVVVKLWNGTCERTLKRVSELTNKEAALAFDVDKLRPVPEQMKLVKAVRRPVHTGNTRPTEADTEEETASGRVFLLDETPLQEICRQLLRCSNALLATRTALMMIDRESKYDELITTALRAVGELRYAANEGNIKREKAA